MRRQLRETLVIFYLLVMCSSGLAAYGEDREGFSILQGTTTSTETVLSILLPQGGKNKILLSEGTNPPQLLFETGKSTSTSAYLLETQTLPLNRTGFEILNLYIHGLKRQKKYTLKVQRESIKKSKNSLIDIREFQTLREPTSKKPLRFVVGSCIHTKYRGRAPKIWNSITSQNPDAILLLGDNVYVNLPSLRFVNFKKKFESRYVHTRLSTDLYFQKKLTPVFAIWDDNDYGEKDGGKEFKHKAYTSKMFQAFFPRLKKHRLFSMSKSKTNQNMTLESVALKFDIGKSKFTMLDNRSFRDVRGKSAKSGAHHGKTQLMLLKHRLQEKGNHYIASGNEFFGAHHKFESYEKDHPEEFKEFIQIIKNSRKKVFLMGGDRHLSSLSQLSKEDIGQETLELVASPIYSRLHKKSFKKYPNPRMIEGISNKENFVLVEELSQQEFGHQIQALDHKNNVLWKYRKTPK